MTSPPAALNLDAVRAWLAGFYGRSPGFIGISWVAPSGRFTNKVLETVEAAVELVAQLDRSGAPSIYHRVTTLRERPPAGHRGDAELSHAFRGLWADLDIAGPGHKATPAPLPPDETTARHVTIAAGLPAPTLWVHSGGGLYPWWLLAEPHIIGDDRAEITALSTMWQEALIQGAKSLGYHYGNVGDLPRVLRIPGSVNHKTEVPRPCVLLPDTGPVYRLDQLREIAESLSRPPAPAPSSTPARTFAQPSAWDQPGMGGGPGPFDVLVETARWADLLEPMGWAYVRSERDGAELWKRPGGTSEYSARCNHNGTPVMVAWSTDAGLPSGSGHKLTMARVFAHFHHCGDESAAASDLRAAAAGDPAASPAARSLPAHVLSSIAARCNVARWSPPPGPSRSEMADQLDAVLTAVRDYRDAHGDLGLHEKPHKQYGTEHRFRCPAHVDERLSTSSAALAVTKTKVALYSGPNNRTSTDHQRS